MIQPRHLVGKLRFSHPGHSSAPHPPTHTQPLGFIKNVTDCHLVEPNLSRHAFINRQKPHSNSNGSILGQLGNCPLRWEILEGKSTMNRPDSGVKAKGQGSSVICGKPANPTDRRALHNQMCSEETGSCLCCPCLVR